MRQGHVYDQVEAQWDSCLQVDFVEGLNLKWFNWGNDLIQAAFWTEVLDIEQGSKNDSGRNVETPGHDQMLQTGGQVLLSDVLRETFNLNIWMLYVCGFLCHKESYQHVSKAFYPAHFHDWVQVVPDKALGAQIGNAMSQNILEP